MEYSSDSDIETPSISDDKILSELYDIVKTNYYEQIKNIDNNIIKSSIINNITNDLKQLFKTNYYLDKLAKDFKFIKTNLNSILTKNIKDKNSNLYFYVDNINTVYQSSNYKNIKQFIEIICEKNETKQLVQIISNDSKRKCIFNYFGSDKNNIISKLKKKYNYQINSCNNYIICDIIAEDYNNYTQICENIFKYLASKSIKYDDMSIIKNKYDVTSDHFYSEFVFNLDKNNYKEIINSLPIPENLHNIILNIYDNSVKVTGDKNNIINGNNNILQLNDRNKAKEWLKNKNYNDIRIKDIINDFKKDNPNVKSSDKFIANLLKELDYKHVRGINYNYWKK